MLKSAASSSFSIDWGSVGLVVVASLAAAVVIVTLFSVALRLLASGETPETGSGGSAATHRSPMATGAAYLCFAVCAAVVLYGLYLVIPIFHRS